MDFDIIAFLLTQVMTLAGAVAAAIAVIIVMRGRRGSSRRSLSATALVLDNEHHRERVGVGADAMRTSGYYPVVRFTPSGRTEPVQAVSRYGTGSIVYEAGTRVDVRYDPDDPSDFQLPNHRLFVAPPALILSGIALVFLLMGVFMGYMVVTGQMG